jgi:hypothetical protein
MVCQFPEAFVRNVTVILSPLTSSTCICKEILPTETPVAPRAGDSEKRVGGRFPVNDVCETTLRSFI